MQKKYVIFSVVLAWSIFILGGCASTGGLITSLEDLTTETSKEGFIKVPQYREISISGLLPFPEPGSLHFFKPRRKPSSSIGISHSDKSYVIQSVIDSECDLPCLIPIRDKLLLLRGSAERLVEERIKLTKLIATPPPASDATAIGTYKTEIAKEQSNYTTKRNELDQNYKETLEAIKANGILIYRWNSNSKRSGSLGLGDILGVSGNKSESYSGFALASGLRTATLYVGKDIIEAWERLDTKSNFSNRFELTTHVMQAQHIIYITEYDLQGMVEAKLKASYAQLADLPETIKSLEQIEINAALSKVANLSNMGIIGKSKITTRDVDWTKPAGITKIQDLDGWQTFYAVESDLTDLIQMMSENKI